MEVQACYNCGGTGQVLLGVCPLCKGARRLRRDAGGWFPDEGCGPKFGAASRYMLHDGPVPDFIVALILRRL